MRRAVSLMSTWVFESQSRAAISPLLEACGISSYQRFCSSPALGMKNELNTCRKAGTAPPQPTRIKSISSRDCSVSLSPRL
jgi:hypothetical protein